MGPDQGAAQAQRRGSVGGGPGSSLLLRRQRERGTVVAASLMDGHDKARWWQWDLAPAAGRGGLREAASSPVDGHGEVWWRQRDAATCERPRRRDKTATGGGGGWTMGTTTISKNMSFTMILVLRRLGLTASVNDFLPSRLIFIVVVKLIICVT